MRVVVTGAAGFIGSHLTEALVEGGHHVVGLDCFTDYYSPGVKRQNIKGLMDSTLFSFHEVDLRYEDLDVMIEGADAVINEAAMPGLRRGWSDLNCYLDCNVLAAQRLIEASRRCGVKLFIQASTSSVYGTVASCEETGRTEPVSPYGITKLAAENLVRAYSTAFEFPAIILRYFSIYGPRQRPDMAYYEFIRRLSSVGPELTVFGDGAQSRSNTFVDDCIAGTLSALYRGVPGETYNIGGGTVITLLEAIDLIASELHIKPVLTFAPPQPGDQRHTAANIGKARSELGYSPKIDPPEGIRRQIAWQTNVMRPVR